MHIVINISEDDYRKVQDGRASVSMMQKAIINGTPKISRQWRKRGRTMRLRLLSTLLKVYRKWIMGECRHICKTCQFNNNCKEENWWTDFSYYIEGEEDE